jgi:hypothetical protein
VRHGFVKLEQTNRLNGVKRISPPHPWRTGTSTSTDRDVRLYG